MLQVPPRMKERMTLSGALLVGYTRLAHKGLKNFFRLVLTCHPPATQHHMDYVVQELESCGNDIRF